MTQPIIDWDRDVNLPIAGRSPRSRHASATGAQRAAKDRGALSLAYLSLLRLKPLTDHEAAAALGRYPGSICSTRNGLGRFVVDSGEYQVTDFGTKRTLWKAAL